MIKAGGLVQVALAAGDLNDTLSFWNDVLGIAPHARFEPPGIAFLLVGRVRLLFAPATTPGAVYLAISDMDETVTKLEAAGVVLEVPPTLVFEDSEGLFGAPGQAEWMAFLRDPAENTIGLVHRRPISA
ncbi:Glyoxalase-like domain protein [Hartmannibacter diazotrophicus]|uniref:Glyoxalase-like domain protein n=1 Tax=Hartmannibacter diazotrophicus TaxID=1482074 RepID=A0A2C9D6J2_9HYPH|nr:VOC family protein [Hartmannibacter diazotrophicus]SON55944.1 Glyoxalase-like domain protein [Hartmannibacter diazotrophicus]